MIRRCFAFEKYYGSEVGRTISQILLIELINVEDFIFHSMRKKMKRKLFPLNSSVPKHCTIQSVVLCFYLKIQLYVYTLRNRSKIYKTIISIFKVSPRSIAVGKQSKK